MAESISKILVKRISDFCLIVDEEFKLLNNVADAAFYQFQRNHQSIKNKYSALSPWNVDQCIHYSIFIQSFLYKNNYYELSEKVYYFIRVNFNLDIFPSRRLPDSFLLVHPIGSVLGDAQYGNWLVVYQGVTIGGNPQLDYPTLSDGVVLYSGAKVIGRSQIGSNVIVGAGVTIINEEIPNNTICFLDKKNQRQFKLNKLDNKSRYFQ